MSRTTSTSEVEAGEGILVELRTVIKVSLESPAEATEALASAGALDNKDMTKVNNSEFSSPLAAKRADLAEAETGLAAVLASVAASKNSCAHKTADQEVSVKTMAEELNTSADSTQILRSETSPVEGLWYSLFQVCSFTVAHTTMKPEGLGVEMMTRRLAQKEHSAALSLSWSRVCLLS